MQILFWNLGQAIYSIWGLILLTVRGIISNLCTGFTGSLWNQLRVSKLYWFAKVESVLTGLCSHAAGSPHVCPTCSVSPAVNQDVLSWRRQDQLLQLCPGFLKLIWLKRGCNNVLRWDLYFEIYLVLFVEAWKYIKPLKVHSFFFCFLYFTSSEV